MEGLFVVQGIILLLLLYFVLKPHTILNFPPSIARFKNGPRFAFPLLGHLPLLGRQPHKRLIQWKSSYGPIIGLWLGNHRAVAISDPELIKEALNSPAIAGRCSLGIFRDWGLGLVTAEGQHHHDQRKFTLRQMKNYGFGSSSLESIIQDEVVRTLQDLKQYVGKPLRLGLDGMFEKPAGKILWHFLIHEKGESDLELHRTLRRIASLVRDNTSAIGIVMFLPWIGTLFPKLTGMKRYQTSNQQIDKFIKDRVDVHNKSREDIPRDFVDAYMEQVSKSKNPDSCFHPRHNSIVHLVKDLIIAGTESVGTSLTWLLLYMVTWPDIQQKLQNEIDVVVGHERYPSLLDRPQMPYSLAVIYELLRFSSVLPLGPAHRATEDVIFRGFYLPKGTIVIPNFYAAHFDKEFWVDPENFRPERFLDSSGNIVQGNENLMPFSLGKRACPGEVGAMDELFLFTVHLFWAFKVEAGAKLPPSLEGHYGVTMTPRPFDVVLTVRRE